LCLFVLFCKQILGNFVADHHQQKKPGDLTTIIPPAKVEGGWGGGNGHAIGPNEDSLLLARDPRIYAKVFVVSGSLASLTHEEIRGALESRGALFSRRISKKTDYLIAGRKPGSPAITARIYKIPILNETDLLNLLGINRQFSLDL
jgi:NAD-dependent DNA ligase